MKRILKISVISLTAALIFLTGCKSLPVYNVEKSPINITVQHSAKDIKKAIINAAVSLGWAMKSVNPGLLVATYYRGRHIAIINIRYTKKYYSIKYKESKGLSYNGESIHKRYNVWIKNLDNRIQVQLSAI